MKKTLFLFAAAILDLATRNPGSDRKSAHAPTFGIPDDKMEVLDTQKMQLIEDWARRSNVDVIWYRKPTRLVPKPVVASS